MACEEVLLFEVFRSQPSESLARDISHGVVLGSPGHAEHDPRVRAQIQRLDEEAQVPTYHLQHRLHGLDPPSSLP